MKRGKLKISVITPSYNQGNYIEKTIRSVIGQDYENLEYIIIDGGSTDSTCEIIKKYEEKITYWQSKRDNGQADAINQGFAKATGDILCWLNSDDYFLPGALKTIGGLDWDNYDGVVGIGHKIDHTGKIIYTPKVPALNYSTFLRWIGYGNFMQPACFFSSRAWDNCGPLTTKYNYCFDVDLWLKMSQNFNFFKLEKDIAHALIHPKAKTTAEKLMMKLETSVMLASHADGINEALKIIRQLNENEILDSQKTYQIIKYLIKRILRT